MVDDSGACREMGGGMYELLPGVGVVSKGTREFETAYDDKDPRFDAVEELEYIYTKVNITKK